MLTHFGFLWLLRVTGARPCGTADRTSRKPRHSQRLASRNSWVRKLSKLPGHEVDADQHHEQVSVPTQETEGGRVHSEARDPTSGSRNPIVFVVVCLRLPRWSECSSRTVHLCLYDMLRLHQPPPTACWLTPVKPMPFGSMTVTQDEFVDVDMF